jgi:rubredoxin-NAD+ reductase
MLIECDLVLSAVGLRPRIELAAAAGLAVNRGVEVDRHLRTSHANIFALGDCAEVDGINLLYVMPLMNCARALAQTLAGNPTAVAYGPMPVTVKTPACPLVVSAPPRGLDGDWRVEGTGPDIKALCHDSSGALLGYALTGTAVQEKMALNKLLPALLA